MSANPVEHPPKTECKFSFQLTSSRSLPEDARKNASSYAAIEGPMRLSSPPRAFWWQISSSSHRSWRERYLGSNFVTIGEAGGLPSFCVVKRKRSIYTSPIPVVIVDTANESRI